MDWSVHSVSIITQHMHVRRGLSLVSVHLSVCPKILKNESSRFAKVFRGFLDNANNEHTLFRDVYVATWYKSRQFFHHYFQLLLTIATLAPPLSNSHVTVTCNTLSSTALYFIALKSNTRQVFREYTLVTAMCLGYCMQAVPASILLPSVKYAVKYVEQESTWGWGYAISGSQVSQYKPVSVCLLFSVQTLNHESEVKLTLEGSIKLHICKEISVTIIFNHTQLNLASISSYNIWCLLMSSIGSQLHKQELHQLLDQHTL